MRKLIITIIKKGVKRWTDLMKEFTMMEWHTRAISSVLPPVQLETWASFASLYSSLLISTMVLKLQFPLCLNYERKRRHKSVFETSISERTRIYQENKCKQSWNLPQYIQMVSKQWLMDREGIRGEWMDALLKEMDGWNGDYNALEGIHKKTICTYDMCIGKEGRCC